MADHKEEDVARAMKAVRTALNDLQALRASRHSRIPSLLSDAEEALDELCAKLNVLTESPEALSIFRDYTVKKSSNSVEVSLFDAIVCDMEATATYFRTMKPVGLAEIQGELDEQECQNIKEMVDRYKVIISAVLSKHKECVQDEPTRCLYCVDPS
jgi:hypothetical protein